MHRADHNCGLTYSEIIANSQSSIVRAQVAQAFGCLADCPRPTLPRQDMGRAFLTYLQSGDAQAIMARHGL